MRTAHETAGFDLHQFRHIESLWHSTTGFSTTFPHSPIFVSFT